MAKGEAMRSTKNDERYADAVAFREAGHTVYAFTGQVTNVRNFGPKTDLAGDIEAIEAAGWHLADTAWSGIGVLLIFRAAA
jgi:hypothetical protein